MDPLKLFLRHFLTIRKKHFLNFKCILILYQILATAKLKKNYSNQVGNNYTHLIITNTTSKEIKGVYYFFYLLSILILLFGFLSHCNYLTRGQVYIIDEK